MCQRHGWERHCRLMWLPTGKANRYRKPKVPAGPWFRDGLLLQPGNLSDVLVWPVVASLDRET
jgi:hypothetical protein